MGEAEIERAVVRWVRAHHGEAIKLTGTHYSTGWPDRLMVLPHGGFVFIEFKRPGGKCTPLQLKRIAWLRKSGHVAEVFDNVVDCIDFLAACMEAARLSTPSRQVVVQPRRRCTLP